MTRPMFNVLISLKAEARRSASDEPRITVDSNIDFELCVNFIVVWCNGSTKDFGSFSTGSSPVTTTI